VQLHALAAELVLDDGVHAAGTQPDPRLLPAEKALKSLGEELLGRAHPVVREHPQLAQAAGGWIAGPAGRVAGAGR
jgi:hypothetical protein